jgi:hypothetical protein
VVSEGAGSLCQLNERLRVGTGCGGCVEHGPRLPESLSRRRSGEHGDETGLKRATGSAAAARKSRGPATPQG